MTANNFTLLSKLLMISMLLSLISSKVIEKDSPQFKFLQKISPAVSVTPKKLSETSKTD